jgi:superfamily II DNA or RNA helicase
VIQLRQYQQSLIADIGAAYRRGAKSVLGVAPTASGKTVMFSYIAQGLQRRGKRAVILVHRQELVEQTHRMLQKFDVPHGIIQSQRGMDLSHPIHVASIQTLARRLSIVPTPDLLIMDEAHHATSTTWTKVLHHYPTARVLGVTATPERLDGKGLCQHFEQLVLGPSVTDLIQQGYLSRPVYYAPPGIDMQGAGIRAGDFKREEAESRADKPTITGDAITHYRNLCNGKPSIAFCVSVRHAEHVAAGFREAGFRASVIEGSLSDADRRERIRDLGNGRLHVLTSCEILGEGVDIPVVEAAILLRPTASLALHLQQIGRVLRVCPGKEHSIILDHAGNTSRHGLAEDHREWSLLGAAERKRREAELKTVKYRQCPKCYAVHAPLPVCPECGWEYILKPREVEQVDGELVSIGGWQQCTGCGHAHSDRDASCPKCGLVTDPSRAKRKEQGRAQTMQELIALGRRRGYKNPYMWAKFTWQARQRRAAA